MESKRMINDMTEGNITRQLLKFSVPFMLSSLLQTLYAAVDMMVVGQFVGQSGLSAVSVGSSLVQFFTLLSIGYSGAGQVMIAQYVGARNHEGIRRTIGTIFSVLGIVAVLAGLICLTFPAPLLGLLNTPAEAFDAAAAYMRICGCGMLFIYGYNTVSAILRGMGDSKRPLLFIAIAAAVNVVLDLVLVAGLHMGVAGAAVATVAGQAVSFLWSVFYLYRRREQFDFDFKPASFAIHGRTLAALSKLGLPMALQTAAISISILFISSYVNSYGVTASALTGAGQKLFGLVNIVSNAVGTSMSTMVGQNMAAGKPERVKKLVRTSLLICVCTTGTISLICLAFPQQVISIFNSEPELLAMASEYIPILVVGFMAGSLMCPYYGLVNGIGYAGLSLVIGLLDGVVARVGLSLLFGLAMGMGIHGFWLGDALAGFVTAFLSAAYYYSGRWKTRKLLIEQ